MLKSKKVITIIIPTFNSEDTIESCLSSINFSLGENIEKINVLVCDGVSTDKTLELINDMNYSWVTIISKPDNGIYDAMNSGIKCCNTDWVYFLGSDDVLLSGFNNMLKNLIGNKIFYGDVVLTSNASIYGGVFSNLKLVFKNINHQSVFYPRTILLDHLFDLKYRYLSDWNTNIILFHKFSYLPFVVAKYNDETGASSTLIDYKFMEDKNSIVYKYLGFKCFVFSNLLKFMGKVKNVVKSQ